MVSVFVPSGPAEILRAVQKDRLLYELIEKHLTNILLKIGGIVMHYVLSFGNCILSFYVFCYYFLIGTAIWLRYRQLVQFTSRFLYYTFTTLSGYQTLGEEYTDIVQVDASLRQTPSFLVSTIY